MKLPVVEFQTIPEKQKTRGLVGKQSSRRLEIEGEERDLPLESMNRLEKEKSDEEHDLGI